MVYITQLIYVKPGEEETFDRFEAVAIPTILKYNGRLLLRLRPDAPAVIERDIDAPYEVHLVAFETEADLQRFMQDEERTRFLHLKAQSVERMLLIKGAAL